MKVLRTCLAGKAALLLLLGFILTGCSLDFGTAESFGGGDPMLVALNEIRRDILTPAAAALGGGNVSYALGAFSQFCPDTSNPLCASAPSLTSEEAIFCQDFVLRNILSMHQRLLSPEIYFVVVADGLEVNGSSVLARTSLSSAGPIEVSSPAVNAAGLRRIELAALIAHEMLHKVSDASTGSFTDDEVDLGPFTGPGSGARLLTAAGYALAFYAQKLGLDPEWDPGSPVIGEGRLSVSEAPASKFGVKPVGVMSTKSLRVLNEGSGPITGFNLTTLSAPFSITGGSCTSITQLGASASCTLEIGFRPTSEGNYSSGLTMNYQTASHSASFYLPTLGSGRLPYLYAALQGSPSSISVSHMQTGAAVTGSPFDGLIPFTPAVGYTGAIEIAVGDVDGDGKFDLATSAASNPFSTVKVFSGSTGLPITGPFEGFEAFPGNPAGSAVALGDVNGDGKADVAVGATAAVGSIPQARLFLNDGRLQLNFNAYSPSFRGGMSIAMGDVNGDGLAEIITGAGSGGASEVKVFSSATATQLLGFSAFSGFNGPVFVAAGDINADGQAEILVAPGPGGGSAIKIFEGKTGKFLNSVMPFGATYNGGLKIALGDVDTNGRPDLVTYAISPGLPVRVLSNVGYAEIASFLLGQSASTMFLGINF